MEGRIGIDVAEISKDEKPKKVVRTTKSSKTSGLMARFREIDYTTLEWPGDTPSTIIYTSGTTGPPKVRAEEADTLREPCS